MLIKIESIRCPDVTGLVSGCLRNCRPDTPEYAKIMAQEIYWEGLYIIPWIFMAYYFQFLYAFEVNVEFALKKTKLISIGTIFSALVNIILNLLFIPIFGYIAAAITTAISYFLLFLFHYFLTSRIIKRNIYGFRFHLNSIVYVLISTIFFTAFRDHLMIRVIGIFIALLLFYKSIRPILNEYRFN